eukprot:2037154-Pyramimonas_sp.AAC.1
MRDDWQQQWCPGGPPDRARQHLRAWKGYADNVEFLKSDRPVDWLPSIDTLDHITSHAKGAAGLDGWGAHELRAVR